MGPHVFGDDRLGLWIVDPGRGVGRLSAIRAFAAGAITDLYLPRTATPAHFDQVRATGFNAHLWVAVDGLNAPDYAARTLDDLNRLRPGACELNVELGVDSALEPYMREAVARIRARRRSFRLRLNVAPYKGAFVPADLLQSDPQLYVAEQTYYGDMSRVSEAEALLDLLGYGVPPAKASLCYGAAGPTCRSSARVCTLPTFFYAGQLVRSLRRGVIFQDDLMADAGLI